MSQKIPVNKFKWVKNTFQFNEHLIKKYIEENDEVYFLEVAVQYPEKLHERQNDLPYLSERRKIENVKKLVNNLHDKISFT